MPAHPFHSPLRYPGGKRKLANFLKLVLSSNRLHDVHYIEPFAGGASVALSLLFEEYAERVTINDLDPSIFSFWKACTTQTEELCEKIRSCEVTLGEWEKQREIQLSKEPKSNLDLAFSTFFLNRTNRSGIIWGGVIGGKNQEGKWKIDARFNREDLIQRIRKIGRFSSRILVSNQDASNMLSNAQKDLTDSQFYYLDPPYFEKGSELYLNHFSDTDHKKLAEAIANLERPWIVSYDNQPRIQQLYDRFRTVTYDLSYSAQDRYKGKEIIVFSNCLEIPDVETPASIPKKTLAIYEAQLAG